MRGSATLRNDGQPWWRLARRWRRAQVPAYVRPWLRDEASLTRRLRRAGRGPFRVAVYRQRWQRPQPNECRLLGLRRGERSLVREVHLYTGDVPRVFARTVIPAGSLRRRGRLARLGQRSLGATLFAQRNLGRGVRQWARLDAGHASFADAVCVLARRPEALWGRRATFRLGQRSLLVTEVFLPTIAECGVPR